MVLEITRYNLKRYQFPWSLHPVQPFTGTQIASPSILRLHFGIASGFRQKFSFVSRFFRIAGDGPVLPSVAAIFWTGGPRAGVPIRTRESLAGLFDGRSLFFAFRIFDRESFSVRQNLMTVDDSILFPVITASGRTWFPCGREPSKKSFWLQTNFWLIKDFVVKNYFQIFVFGKIEKEKVSQNFTPI